MWDGSERNVEPLNDYVKRSQLSEPNVRSSVKVIESVVELSYSRQPD